jgi:hypothetical protein
MNYEFWKNNNYHINNANNELDTTIQASDVLRHFPSIVY